MPNAYDMLQKAISVVRGNVEDRGLRVKLVALMRQAYRDMVDPDLKKEG